MTDNSPRLDLPYLQPSQAQKHVTHNAALQRLDAVTQMTVVEFDATTTPTAPLAGDVYALGTAPTGAWAGNDGMIALWDGVAWQFFAPVNGWRAWGLAENELRVHDGTDWQPVDGGMQNLDGIGIGTTWDATNRLAVASDAALFTHVGTGQQVKVNKAAAGDTASLLFQTAFTSHAEMGLAGTDDFSIKVSPDGSVFHEAMTVDRSTGKVTFPSGTDGTGSAAGALGGQVIAVTGEKSGTLVVGQYMSMGNGSVSGAGAVMPFAGKVMAASISTASGTAGTNTVSMSKNKVEHSGYQATVVYSGSGADSAYSDFSAAPLSFASGDALNMKVAASSGAGSVVTTFFLVFD